MPGTVPVRPYSYRQDPHVPDFDDAGPVAFMDGECVLCTRGARMIARLDRRLGIRICPVNSPLGQAMLCHLGLDPDDTETWVYLRHGVAHTSLAAIILLGRDIGGPGHLLAPFALLPRGTQDWLYRRIARNRYAMFGRTDMCAVPDEKLRHRLLT